MQGSDTKLIFVVCLIASGLASGCAAFAASAARGAAPGAAFRTYPDFTECLVEHFSTHPDLAAQDVYKFVHQSVAGPGHLIPGGQQALAYLQQEIAGLGEAPSGEPLYEALGGEYDLVRLNLRPYVKRGGDPERLVEAMQLTAAAVTLRETEMSKRLRIGAAMLSQRGLQAESDALVGMLEEYASQGFPALHHSDRYAAAYHPAYRVISRTQADRLAGYLSSEDRPRSR